MGMLLAILLYLEFRGEFCSIATELLKEKLMLLLGESLRLLLLLFWKGGLVTLSCS